MVSNNVLNNRVHCKYSNSRPCLKIFFYVDFRQKDTAVMA